MTDENKKPDYYVMPVTPEQKSRMDKEGVPEAMSSIAGSDGLIQVELERDVVIERIARDLYKDPKAGVREYVNNEARQCREAMRLGHDASIYITVNGHTRTITIEGRGSMGMTMQMFKDVYTVLGRSGNLDGNESGQFGFGRAAYLCLSDIVIFETFSRETNERFGFLGKGGKVYEPIPERALSIKEYGSKATMTVREGVDMYELVEYSKKVSRFLDVSVYLIIATPVSDKYNSIDAGIEQIGPVDKREYIVKNNHYYMSTRKSWVEIDNEDYKLEGYVTNRRYNTETTFLLVGIPVESFPVINPMGGFLVINIKNERKFQPTASRDSMSQDAQDKLSEMIKKDVCEYLSRIEVNCLNDFAKAKDMALIENAMHLNENYEISDNVRILSKLVNTRFVVATDEKRPHKFGPKNILMLADVLEKSQKIICSRTKKTSVIDTLLDRDPDAVVLTPHGKWTGDMEAVFENLRKFGALDLKEYMESKKINVQKEKQEGMTAYSIDGTPEITSVHAMHAGIVRIPRNIKIQDFLYNMRQKSVWGVKFAKDSKRLDSTPTKTLEAVCKKAKRTKYNTSEGIMTGTKILKQYESGFAILKKADFGQPDIATHERCKRAIRNIELIVDEPDNAYHSVPPTVALMLAHHASNKDDAHFTIIDGDDEKNILNEYALESLEIEVQGRWRTHAKEARAYLEQINNGTVREMYARFYNMTGSWMRIEYTTPQDFPSNNVAGIFAAIDAWAAGKTKLEACIGLLGMKWNHRKRSDKVCNNYSLSRYGVPLWIKRLAVECIAGQMDKKDQLQFVLNALFDAGKIKSKITVNNIDTDNPYSRQLTITTDTKPIRLNNESPIIHAIWAVWTAMDLGRNMPRLYSMEITKGQKLKMLIGNN